MTYYFFSFLADQKGNGFSLLRLGTKRRRTKQEISDEKEELELKEQAVQEKLYAAETMLQKVQDLEAQVQVNQQSKDFIEHLLDTGVLAKDIYGQIDVANNA